VAIPHEEPADRCARYEFNELTDVADGNTTLLIDYRAGRCSGARWVFGYLRFRNSWHRPEAVVW